MEDVACLRRVHRVAVTAEVGMFDGDFRSYLRWVRKKNVDRGPADPTYTGDANRKARPSHFVYFYPGGRDH